MLLPKGIVFNDDRIYKEIASYDVIPPEKIYDYWHGTETAASALWLCTTLTKSQFIPQPTSS